MPRRARRAKRWLRDVDEFQVVLGPGMYRDDTDADVEERTELLEAWWGIYGEDFERRHRERIPGSRSWCWWAFEAGEEMPCRDECVQRLLELDALDGAEMTALMSIGERIVADQLGGRVCHLECPQQVRDANVVRRHLGLPSLDEHVFHLDVLKAPELTRDQPSTTYVGENVIERNGKR
jgi:alkanesulfonate monooxygenase SsuD/methylene tetrahydromethanopterin reductase-like flavin-dependent oxidoreductase (luciferase family)